MLKNKFTLIELLVVVAIIAILAAMLLPTLMKAKYRARLVVCTNNQKQLGQGILMYTGDFKGFYPERQKVTEDTDKVKVTDIKSHAYDERDLYRPYFNINANFNDTFTTPVDLDSSTASVIESSYGLWWGIQLLPNEKRMLMVGDTFTYKGEEFNILAGDWEINLGGGSVEAGHYDSRNVLRENIQETSDSYLSRWEGADRGTMDKQFVYDDGHVKMFQNQTEDNDDLTKAVGFTKGHKAASWSVSIPSIDD